MAIFGRKKRKGRESESAAVPAVPPKGVASQRSIVSAPNPSTSTARSNANGAPTQNGTIPNSMSILARSSMLIPDPDMPPDVLKGPIDDFGRPIKRPVPALSNASLARRPASPDLRYGVGEGEDENDPASLIELQLLYGYSPLYPTLELAVSQVADICELCGHYLTIRGLDTPLLLSSMALDLNIEGPSTLAKAYVNDRQAWADEVALASPLSLAAHMKWALARLAPKPGHPDRGFVAYKDYEMFRRTEQGLQFPPLHMPSHFAARLDADEQRLLGVLLSLFSSIAAHSTTSGCTPRRIAALFSPYIFGLPNSASFDETYEAWILNTAGLEHILVAFMRAQKENMPVFPTHLEKFLVDYPRLLELHPTVAKPAKNPKLEEVIRFRRFARFHSRDLVQTAHASWDLLCPTGQKPPKAVPTYTADYKQMLNIQPYKFEDEDDQSILQKYKTSADKTWGEFGQSGFKDVDRSKLEFDLTEGETAKLRQRRATVDWTTFESDGFNAQQAFGTHDMIFNQAISRQVTGWSSNQQALDKQIRQTEKALPDFKHDTTPREEGKTLVDAQFFECWADVLVGAGWTRDEMKEWNWALLQYKARPTGEGSLPGSPGKSDDRTSSRWILVEEQTPREYLEDLRAGKIKKKRPSFLTSVRRKNSRLGVPRLRALPVTPENDVAPPLQPIHESQNLHPDLMNESFLSPEYETRKLSLTSSRLLGGEASEYAPSIVSTTGAGHGHAAPSTLAPSTINISDPNQSSMPMEAQASRSTVHVPITNVQTEEIPSVRVSEERPPTMSTEEPSSIVPNESSPIPAAATALAPPVEHIAAAKPGKKRFMDRLKTLGKGSGKKEKRTSMFAGESIVPKAAGLNGQQQRHGSYQSSAPAPTPPAKDDSHVESRNENPYDGIEPVEEEQQRHAARASHEVDDSLRVGSAAMQPSESMQDLDDAEIVTDAQRIKVVGRVSSDDLNRSIPNGGESNDTMTPAQQDQLSHSNAMSEFKSRVSSIAKQYEERERELKESQARVAKRDV